jgi:murein DD-endopeptidase MepM/ murein hydrolase activator NlpD
MRISESAARLGLTSAKFVITAMTAALLAGCSDSIERFASNYNNPSDADPVYTASVPKYKKLAYKPHYTKPQQLASSEETILQSPIASAPLNTPKRYDYTKAYQRPKLALNQVPDAPVYEAPSYKAPTYKAPTYKAPTYKAPLIAEEEAQPEQVLPVAKAPVTFKYKKPALVAEAPAEEIAPVAIKHSANIQVGDGMTMYSIAKANGLSVQQLAAANGIAAPYTVSKGRVLRIPGNGAIAHVPTIAKPEVVAQVDPVAAPVRLKAGSKHTVAQGDTLFSLGRKYGVSPYTIADLNGLSHSKALSIGQALKIPTGGKIVAAAIDKPVVETSDDQTAQADIPVTNKAPLALPKAETTPKLVADNAAPAEATGLSLRWPVKGKIISEFGAKPNGLKNEGINIAVPEGTGIRAAEEGVVAYAGNELKGYGNLVLIRHAGGYVTAYAHASQLLVKRGDTVKRGDVIAKAGQTGAVQSPQLHFEVRKGASALNPSSYLNASTAMN